MIVGATLVSRIVILSTLSRVPTSCCAAGPQTAGLHQPHELQTVDDGLAHTVEWA